MMTNLFNIFDPSTSMNFNLNWFSTIMNLMLMPLIFWMKSSRYSIFLKTLIKFMFKEMIIILNNSFNKTNSIYLISLFLMILMNNFMGMFSYIFTSSSHMIFSLSLSIPLWLSLFIFMLKKNMNFMFSHMIPSGTPFILMPFMVLIESISNIIRPMTLSIRLTANMIAGHLLITLMSNSANSNFLTLTMLVISLQMILLTLEFSVALIQSYVFSILSTLYIKETN